MDAGQHLNRGTSAIYASERLALRHPHSPRGEWAIKRKHQSRKSEACSDFMLTLSSVMSWSTPKLITVSSPT